MSYYRTIGGRRYDRALLEQAEQMTTGQGDGRISEADAQQLLTLARDGDSITEAERETLRYILSEFKVTDAARQWLEQQLDQLPGADAAVTIERVVRKEFGLTELTLHIDPTEVARQSELAGEVPFEIGLRFALISFFEDEMAPETPRGLVIQTHQLSPDGFPDGQAYEKAVAEKLRSYLNDHGTFTLLPQQEGAPDNGLAFPKDGEQVADHWVFALTIPQLTGHTYWGIVHRDGKRPAYNYGFK
jgi:hypothetical protein